MSDSAVESRARYVLAFDVARLIFFLISFKSNLPSWIVTTDVYTSSERVFESKPSRWNLPTVSRFGPARIISADTLRVSMTLTVSESSRVSVLAVRFRWNASTTGWVVSFV